MKKSLILQFILIVFLMAAGCQRRVVMRHPGSTRSMPPGQAKKVYGHQSARAFAPGQQKKKVHFHSPKQENKHKKGKKKK